MNKFSTKKLKMMISTWLSNSTFKEDLNYFFDFDNEEEFQYQKKLNYDVPESIKTKDQFDEYSWKLITNGLNWRRDRKHKLGDEQFLFFGNRFAVGMAGECNDLLVEKYCTDIKQLSICILREFIPNNEFALTFRLHVVTTPEDDEIIGWSLFAE
jgi:hypothetical protein